eukprot:Nk52_evm19s287 gene=Nk52_evmTU19s287
MSEGKATGGSGLQIGQTTKDIVSGTAGGIAQVLIGQPFDTLKVRLQTQSSVNPIYSGVGDCLKKTVKNEGFSALYKGTLAPLIGIGACVSIQFAVVEAAKRNLRAIRPSGELSTSDFFACGLVAGFANSFVTTPVEHIRIRMQVQKPEPGKPMKYANTLDCYAKIFKQGGIRSVYKGGVLTFARESLGFGFYFMAYETMINFFCNLHEKKRTVGELKSYEIIGSAISAGVSYWVSTYPIDAVKSNFQTDSFSNPKYPTNMSALRHMYSSGGISGLYRGVGIATARAIPAVTGTFMAFETTMNLLGREEIKLSFYVVGYYKGMGGLQIMIEFKDVQYCEEKEGKEERMVNKTEEAVILKL